MKAFYYTLLLGMAIAFVLLGLATYALLSPVNIPDKSDLVAMPSEVKAGQLVSYEIKNCQEDKNRGVTSVNLQSTDVPPSITVAVAAPSPQAIHCHNVILIPRPIPTGDYRLLVFISFDTNPIKNTFSPIRRNYVSNIIHVINDSPDYKLPTNVIAPTPTTSSPRRVSPSGSGATGPTAKTEKSSQPKPTNPAQAPEKRRTLTQQITERLTNLIGGI